MESQRFIDMSKREEKEKTTQREYVIHQRWNHLAEGTYNVIVPCNAADKRMQRENPCHLANDRTSYLKMKNCIKSDSGNAISLAILQFHSFVIQTLSAVL